MFSNPLKAIPLILALFLLAPGPEASAYVPVLTTNDNQVTWHLDEEGGDLPNVIEGSIEFFVNRAGTPDIAEESEGQGGEFEILRLAFRAWEKVPFATVDFNDLRLTDQTLISGIDQTNLIIFDEADHSTLFPLGSGIIALTLLTYEDEEFEGRFDGRIQDADLIFNGQDFRFGQNGEADRIDLLSVATHEIGHIIGLDHSFHQHVPEGGCCLKVPTLFPFLRFGDTQARSLEPDDIAGMISGYPDDEPNDKFNGSISGRILRATDTDAILPLEGVEVVAYQNGMPVAGAISRTNGVYRIFGVPAGAYILRSLPVSEANLSLPFSPEVDFLSEWYPAAGLSTDASPITVLPGKRRFSFDFDLRLSSQPDFFEPNDATPTATLLSPQGPVMLHQFHRPGDEDWVRFSGVQGRIYEIRTNNLSFFADPVIEVFGADGRTLVSQNDDIDADAGNYAAWVRFTAAVSGDYFVRLTDSDGFWGPGTSFEFSLGDEGEVLKYDTNGDGLVDSMDLLDLSGHWKQTMDNAKAETLDVDGTLLLGVIDYLRQGP